MQIIDLRPKEGNVIQEIAALWIKHEGTRRSDIEATAAWIESRCSAPSCISRVALDDVDTMLGWYCAVEELSRKIWRADKEIFTAAEEIEQVQNFIDCLREVNLK